MSSVNDISVWTALITPMLNNGDIDFKSLEFCVLKQEKAGNGILLVGSTGEGLALTNLEQRSIVQYVCNMHLTVPVMVGVGGYQLQSQLEWLAFCETQNVDAYLMVTPIYAKPGIVGQTKWFEKLMNAVDKPCMLYNVPSRSGVNIHHDVLSRLSNHNNLWALKEASGSLDKFLQYSHVNQDIQIFSGEDSLIPELASLGSAGVVSVIANVWPAATNCYMQQAINNEVTYQSADLWKKASKLLFVASNPIPAKAILAEFNWISTPYLRAPLNIEDMNRLTELIEVSKEIGIWYLDNIKNTQKIHAA